MDTSAMYNQKVGYIHINPVAAAFVAEPQHWIHGSAADYYTDKKGLLVIAFFEGFKILIQ
ncbi:MAG: hypothetical protein ABIN67_14345 [Ferruginibacter sp.]